MRVWVAEKESVARALAEQAGTPMPGDGFYRTDDDIFTWAQGHLFGLAPPERYRSEWKRWRQKDLPLLPDPLRVVPLRGHKKRIASLRKLLRDPQTKEIINACDAGREGELIFYWILFGEKSFVQKKYRHRLWLDALSPKAISRAMGHLRPAEDFLSLRQAAQARSEADWLLGINATRAATLALGSDMISLGRVQTPTLALVVARDQAYTSFCAEDFWVLRARFLCSNGEYEGEHHLGRMTEQKAQEINNLLRSNAQVRSTSSQKKKEAPPLLYDLTSLQRAASSRWGWTAARTLSVAQELYEKDKVLSYPRTDSRYLPETVRPKDVLQFLPHFQVRDNFQRIFGEVSDHHAIVPVGDGSSLRGNRKKLWGLVAERTQEAFSPDAVALLQKIETECSGEIFITKGKRYLDQGWRQAADEKDLPEVSSGEAVSRKSSRLHKGSTKAPRLYSDGTLLAAMETAGAEIEDEEARQAMKDQGLGTPATRAAVIERLLEVGYIERQDRLLRATEKGKTVVRALQGREILSAELTGRWEADLREIESGADPEDFRDRLRRWVSEETAALLQIKNPDPEWGLCPGCGEPLRENKSAISCWKADDPGCGFALWKRVAGKKLPRSALQDLLQDRRSSLLRGFRSQSGKKFDASLRLQQEDDGSWKTVFE